ncbi:hypothetical protein BHE90_010282 [Fusarium euwallaceae]|uniref:Uncharacterized protein n=2 Tax=Fusarium solani species complex TaxID=232080 RepID=A0A430LHU7_9HYPO|nr:hypothetical protein CEP51_008180 [Fusarium floridanum]RTE75271.1 hypothetical protein BHE90_010282 [Fusarium euwallaceae]
MTSKITLCLLLGCALLGGYGSMFTSYNHGFFDALRVCIAESASPSRQCVLDMSDSIGSVSNIYTGFIHIDSLIQVLLEFFSQGLRGDPDLDGIDMEALLAFGYLAAQFGAAWYLMALEGLRVGNQGTILSWTGTFGIIFQGVTITIIAPIYLMLQLLLSPPTLNPTSILADPFDLALLPISTVISYVLPTIGLCLPLLNVLSPTAKFIAIALWQPFPLYQSVIQAVSRFFCRSRRGRSNKTVHINPRECRKALGRAYTFIATLTMGVHLMVVGIIFTSHTSDLLPEVSGYHILALTSLTDPPTLALLDPPLSATSSREIVVSFLRWDVYCTCASMVIWASYHLSIVRGSSSTTARGLKALLWGLIGGPIFPALMILWERDDIILGRLEENSWYQKEE